MAGHSHWAGIKRKKEVTDQKKGKIFSKILKLITAAARDEANLDFNPRLRTAVAKARDAQIPADTIERAIKNASASALIMEEILCEAYGPGGSAILIEALTDNRNRTIPEIKKILSDNDGKWAQSGSVLWAFEKEESEWKPKFMQEISQDDALSLERLVDALENHDDVQSVTVNCQ